MPGALSQKSRELLHGHKPQRRKLVHAPNCPPEGLGWPLAGDQHLGGARLRKCLGSETQEPVGAIGAVVVDEEGPLWLHISPNKAGQEPIQYLQERFGVIGFAGIQIREGGLATLHSPLHRIACPWMQAAHGG